MHEQPFSVFAITGVVGAILGPILGPLALLMFAAVMGGLLAMGRMDTMTRWEGFRFIAVGVGISLVLTGFAVWMMETFTMVPGNIALMPVSFAIAATRNSLPGLMEKAMEFVANLLGGTSKGTKP
jgi:ABC-type enterobactin transport system permease subunit